MPQQAIVADHHHTDASEVPFIFVSGREDEATRNLVIDPERDFFFSKTTPVETIVSFIDDLKTSSKA